MKQRASTYRQRHWTRSITHKHDRQLYNAPDDAASHEGDQGSLVASAREGTEQDYQATCDIPTENIAYACDGYRAR